MMKTKRWHVPLATAAVAAVAVLSGCSSTTTGETVSSPEVSVSTTTTTTPRTGIARPEHPPLLKPKDAYVIVDDVVQFWRTRGVRLHFSIDERKTLTCSDVPMPPPAAYCFREDRLIYLPVPQETRDDPSKMVAVQAILAHEVGHAVQDWSNRLDDKKSSEPFPGTDVPRGELSADCLSGVYMATQNDAALVDWDNPFRNEAYRKGLSLPRGEDRKCLDDYE